MGLIKTAIIAGVGIYAVKKMSKSNENRRTNPAPGPTQDRGFHQQYFDEPPYYSPGGPYQDDKRAYHQQQHPPPQENFVPLEFTEPRGGRRRQQQQQEDRHPKVLTTSNSAYSPLPHGYNHQDHDGHVYGYDATAQNASESTSNLYAYPNNAPPPHYDNGRQRRQQQQHHGFVEPDEVSDPTFDAPRRGENGKRTGFLDTLAHQAMSIKDGRGKDLVGKLLAR
ncbi:hypothetical protein AYO21_08493 [Fonsecaea monophora]|uniref:Uncharacterized protein n=1 Tax=Fonsecaea monophora TaxID=254056 RepID=A0A177EZA6_9EURO|nr:hypothetical protein AYO21_08493 [Fonsecaea monophora]OAG37308.1 hypothetical protein AYO21_08493 [Fonsecaea monophora]